ncbi:MAG TPA: tetratricopeptide repeat protein [Desulfobacteria bacterium]|nr:tetratricopeptide repeat protein [Desulfobacteria bacterium]
MKNLAIIGLIILFALSGKSVLAENCPKEAMPVEPRLHAVITSTKKEIEKGRNQKALNLLADYSRKNSSKTHPQIPFLKGLIQYRLKRFEKSEILFKKAIELNPCFGEAWQNLAVLYYQQKQPEKAAEAMEKAFSLIKPKNTDLQYQSALFWLMAKEPEKGLATLEQLTKEAPPRTKWLISQAQARKALGQTGKAAEILEKAYEKSLDPDLLYESAVLRIASKEPKKAVALLQKLIRLPHPQRSWFLLLAEILKKEKRTVEAANVLQTAAKRFKAPKLQYQAALLFVHAEKPGSALPLLQGLAAKANAKPQWRTSLVHVLVKLGKNDEAAKVLAKGKAGEGMSTDRFRSALLYLKDGMPQKALPILQQLAKAANPNPHWLIALASTLDRLDRPEDASAAMEKVHPSMPHLSAKMRLQMAIFWLQHDHPKRAFQLLERLAKDPHASKECLMAQIEAMARMGEPQGANKPLKRLLSRYPQDEKIWRLATWAAIEQKDYGKAAAALEVALRLSPPHSGDWKRLGNLYRLAGVPKKAAEAYDKEFGKTPTADNLDLLAATYQQAHQMDKALAAAARAAKLGPSAKRFSRLGQLYMAQEDCAKGLEAFQKAAQIDDSDGVNSLRVGYAACKLDRLAGAKAAFQSALKKADSKSQTAAKATRALKTIEQMMKRQASKITH